MKLSKTELKERFEHIDRLKEEYTNVVPKYSPFIGFPIYIRTYFRWIKEENKHEVYNEMVSRVLKGALNIGTPYTKDELTRLFKYLYERKCDFSGREKWQMGAKLTEQGYADSLINCWGAVADNYEIFCTVFNQLMLGGGFGMSIENKYVSKLPVVKKVNKIEQYHMVHLLPMDEQQQFKETGILIESSDGKALNYLVSDNREGWVELLRLVLKCFFETGQNLFYDTSLVREKGQKIVGFGGVASGVEPLLNSINKIIEILRNAEGRQLTSLEVMDIICLIGQCVVSGNVRRTAIIILGDVFDIDFITSKRWDLHEVPDYRAMANISVNCTNIEDLPKEFWESFTELGESIGLCSVENAKLNGRTGSNKNKDKMNFYPQYFNIDEWSFHDHTYINNLQVDPNVVIFNPCLRKNTPLLTKEGIKQLKDVNIGDEIWSGKQWTKMINKWSTGIKDVFKYKTTAGFIECTDNHRIVQNGEKIEIKYADSIDLSDFVFYKPKNDINPDDVMAGLVYGDGYTKDNYPLLIVGENDQSYYNSEISHLIGITHSKNNTHIVNTYITNEMLKIHLPERKLPEDYLYKNSDILRGFLRGLYSANGSIVRTRITFKSTCFTLIEQVQTILSSLGIKSYYTTNKSKDVEFANGLYNCKESYDLNIGDMQSRCNFNRLIGFIQPYKQEKLNLICEPIISKFSNKSCGKKNFDIISKEFINNEEVFDITVDCEEHTFWSNGLLISNCGEISLENKNCCNLAQINLVNVESYVEFIDILTLLYKQKKHVTQAMYLDSEIQNIANNSSRIGISITSILQAQDKIKWLSSGYTYIRHFDVDYSAANNFPIASKITTVQPAGTGSTADGILNGINAFYFAYGFKLMRVSSSDPLWKVAKKNGYLVENSRTKTGYDENGEVTFTEDKHTKIIYFPMKAPDGAILQENLTAIEHLEWIKLIQQEWADNAISSTVMYHIDELPEIKEWLKHNWKDLKTISFLQKKVESFLQMPYTECTKEEYEIAISKVKPILNLDGYKDGEDFEIDSVECAGGSCPLK